MQMQIYTRYFVFYTEDDPGEKGHRLLIDACKYINAAMGYRKRRHKDGKTRWEGYIILRQGRTYPEKIKKYFPGFNIFRAPSWLDLDEKELPNDIVTYGDHPFISMRENLSSIFEDESKLDIAQILCSFASSISDISDGDSCSV